jgi:hypothetical protein
MSLTLALALAGAVIMAALLGHEWWSNRGQRAQRAQELEANGSSGSGRQEPALEADRGPDTVPDLPQSERIALRRGQRIDPLIDAIVPLVLEQPIHGEAALAHVPPTLRAGGKPYYIEGLDAQTFRWELLAPDRRYKELQAGVQLANRSGALNEIEYSEFVQQVEAFAESIGARADVPDMLEVAARARELDTLAAPLDAQLNFRLRANGVGWSVPYIQKICARSGFVPGSLPGRWVLPSSEPGAPALLILAVDAQAALAEDALASSVSECQLVLDVPQTPESAEPFALMHRIATKLAYDLDATALDGRDQPISLRAFDAIAVELGRLYRDLEALDLTAGTPAARRLFS